MTRAVPAGIFASVLLFAAVSALKASKSQPGNQDRLLGPPFTQRARASLGPDEASVILIEMSDFRCEHCLHFHTRVFPKIKQRYIDTGLIRYVVLPASAPKGEAAPGLFGVAKFALAKGRYWEVRPALYRHAHETDVSKLALQVGVDPAEAAAFARRTDTIEAIAADQAEAVALGMEGTPTFIVRVRNAGGQFVEAKVDGYESWEYFNDFIAGMLERAQR